MSARSRTEGIGAFFSVIKAFIGAVALVALFYIGWLATTEARTINPFIKTAAVATTTQVAATDQTSTAKTSSTTVSTIAAATVTDSVPPAPENPYASAYDSGSEVVIDGNTINAALSTTTKAIDQGLQFQPSLAANNGMLFIFSKAGVYQFWMPHMNFSLDMIWIGSDKKVVSITKDAPPLPDPTKPVWFRPTFPARYVLEVNAGYAGQHGIQVGDAVQFVSIPQ